MRKNKKTVEVEEKEDIKKEKKVKEKPIKKKRTAAERNKLFMQIATWLMVLIMVLGILITIFSPFIFS